jgi:hypothetical protein
MECYNTVLEQYLQHYVVNQQDNWSHWLALAEFTINNHQLDTTGITLFFANKG